MMKRSRKVYVYSLAIAIIIPLFGLQAQSKSSNWKALFIQSYYSGFKSLPPLKPYYFNLSKVNVVENMQPLSYGLDAILAMYEATDSTKYLDDAMEITDNVTGRAEVTQNIPDNKSQLKDAYKGWVVKDSSFDKGVYHSETVLSEIYFYQYVARMLKDIRKHSSLLKVNKYKTFYSRTLRFVETNIWDKWENRGLRFSNNRYNYLLLARTHMACHWAYLAAELYFLTTSSDRKEDYINFVNLYNSELGKKFDKYENYISWDQKFGQDLPRTAVSNRKIDDEVQDVSHANLIVSYIVEASDLGLWKDSDAVNRIINTLKFKLWSPDECLFRDNMDGTMFKSGHKGSVGSFQADGFVKLTRYDVKLFDIYQKFVECSNFLTTWFQYGQLFANLALSQKLLNAHG
jgi:hypothetical protein